MLSEKSKLNLAQAHPLLQLLVNTVIKENPSLRLQINDALRGKKDQEKAFIAGRSKAHYGSSPHNYIPAIALDIYPLPVQFTDLKPYRAMGAIFKETAKRLAIPISWGGDWKSIKDFPHFELSPWTSYAKKAKLYRGND